MTQESSSQNSVKRLLHLMQKDCKFVDHSWMTWVICTIKLTNQPINQQTNQFAEFGEVKFRDKDPRRKNPGWPTAKHCRPTSEL